MKPSLFKIRDIPTSLTDAQIKAFEQRENVAFNTEHRQFIMKFNGGTIFPEVIIPSHRNSFRLQFQRLHFFGILDTDSGHPFNMNPLSEWQFDGRIPFCVADARDYFVAGAGGDSRIFIKESAFEFGEENKYHFMFSSIQSLFESLEFDLSHTFDECPAIFAIMRHDVDGLKEHLERENDPDQVIHGLTLLFHACLHNDYDGAELLLNMGANPNKLSPGTDKVPIWTAARGGGIDIVRLLIRFGASPILPSGEHLADLTPPLPKYVLGCL